MTYDYVAGEEDELSIKQGEIITDVVKHDGGWWEGTINGRKGMFPDNFVKVSDITARFHCLVGYFLQNKMIFQESMLVWATLSK